MSSGGTRSVKFEITSGHFLAAPWQHAAPPYFKVRSLGEKKKQKKRESERETKRDREREKCLEGAAL